MEKKLIFSEVCDYSRYPTGGQLTFAKNLAQVWGPGVALVGCSPDGSHPEGRWSTLEIEGAGEFRFFCVGRFRRPGKKSLVPRRIWGAYKLLKHRKKIGYENFDAVLVQSPEALFTLPRKVLPRTAMRMPGLENPLRISRYFYGKFFAKIYEFLLYRRLTEVKAVLPAADARAIAEFTARSRGKLPPAKVLQFPTRYRADLFHPIHQAEAKRALGWSGEQLTVLTVGRLSKVKGGELMLSAFERFAAVHPNAVMVFVGDGEEENALKAAASRLKYGRAEFAGKLPPEKIALYMNGCDLFVMASHKEGWSTTLVEATACGCVSCATDFSSASEMVRNGVNGFVVTTRDAADFAAHMQKALELDRRGGLEMAREIAKLALPTLKRDLEKALWGEADA